MMFTQVKVNDLVGIPVSGIHKDPDIYPNPTQFNPDNFSKEARQARNPYAFQGHSLLYNEWLIFSVFV